MSSFTFRPQDCSACPLKDRCTPAASRSIGIHEDEQQRMELRQRQQSQAFRDRYRRRPLVERAIQQLAVHGMHQARERRLASGGRRRGITMPIHRSDTRKAPPGGLEQGPTSAVKLSSAASST